MRAALGWILPGAATVLAATTLDCLLLQRRRSYFTGGFLSEDYVSTLPQAAAFLCASLLADAAVLTPLVVIALLAGQRLRLVSVARVTAAMTLALVPVIAADFVAYQLQSFLGDAFDFTLMWNLVGRQPGEILAVSSSHVAWVGGLGLAGLMIVLVAFWTLGRRTREPAPERQGNWLRGALICSVILLVAGTSVVTAARLGSDVLDNGLKRKPTARVLGAIVDFVSDVDRDGYGILGRFSDPAPFDSRVYPFATDIPGDGIDQDGVGGDLPADMPPYREPSGPIPAWPSRQSIVLVALESFRADARGAIVNGLPVTPVLDQLAREGVSAAIAYSHNGYTVQSRHHIFSGSLAGLRNTTLIDDFTANGYETAYFSAQDESFGGPDEDVGFKRAAIAYDARMDLEHRYSRFTTAGSLAVPYNVLNDRVAAFLKQRRREQPLFLYVNYHDTHFPYHHAGIRPLLNAPVLQQFDIVPERRDDLRAMYLNTAANVDRAIGTLLDMVRRDVPGDVGVIVLSDHGESLFDEGFLGHGYALNDAQTRIPLVAAHVPLVIHEPFGQADLRDEIREAMTRAPGRPVIETNPGGQVFQYLGTIDQPAQIGLVGSNTQIVYDFRSKRLRAGSTAWRRPDSLAGADRDAFLRLIRMWERMILAKRGIH